MSIPRRWLRTLVAAVFLLGGAATAQAQITGSLNATAVILARPLTGTGIRPLAFGSVVPGTTANVAPNTPSGAEFRISGVKSRKSIDITFTMPTGLTGPGGATIPLNFNSNVAALCEVDTTGTCVTASYTTWNPIVTPTFHDTPYRYVPGRKTYTYDLYSVYLGGGASPSVNQKPGTYSGTIGVTLVVN